MRGLGAGNGEVDGVAGCRIRAGAIADEGGILQGGIISAPRCAIKRLDCAAFAVFTTSEAASKCFSGIRDGFGVNGAETNGGELVGGLHAVECGLNLKTQPE